MPRLATADDAPALAAMLARAFDDDPVTAWFYRRPGSRGRYLERFFAWQLQRLVPQGQVSTTEDLAGAASAVPRSWDVARRKRMVYGDTPRLWPPCQ